MTDKQTGGPAFPLQFIGPEFEPGHAGMTLRDWFATNALPQAVLDYGEPSATSSAGQRRDRGNPVLPYATKGAGTREQIIARQAYRYADAMLAERERAKE